MLRDLANEVVSGVSLYPFACTTSVDTTGAAVDLGNGQMLSTATLTVGSVSGTGGPTITMKMQSNTTSATTGFTDITGATFTAITTSNGSQTITYQVPAGHRYVRATGTIAGTTSPSLTATVSVQSLKKYATAGTTYDSGASRSPST